MKCAVTTLENKTAGEIELAERYFAEAAFIDIANTHENTADGVHVANAGGIWAALVRGFGGFSDLGDHVRFTPSVPPGWDALRYALNVRGTGLEVTATSSSLLVSVVSGDPIDVEVNGELQTVSDNHAFDLS